MKKVTDIIILTIGRILIMLTSIISIRIFTTLLSPSEIGRLNILLAICSWFSLVVINPVGMYVNRKIIEWNRDGLVQRHLIPLLEFFVVVVGLAIIVVIGLNYFIGLGIDIKIWWIIIIVAGSILLTSGNASFLGWLNLFGKRFSFVFLSVITLWLGLVLSTFFVLKIMAKAEYWFAGQLLGQGLVLVEAAILFLRILGKPASFVIQKDRDFTPSLVFRFAWPLAIGTFLYWCHSQGYRFVFQKIAGTEALGLFAVGFGIGSNLMVAFDTLFNQYYHPIFYNEIANSNEEQRTIAWNKYGSFFFPAIIIMMVYIGVNGPLLAKVFTGERFHYVGNIILWGAVAESLRMMTSATAMVSHAQLEMKPLIIPSIVGAVSAIIGVFILVRFNPFLGGGFAISFGWLLAFLVLFKNMKKLLPIEFPYKRVLYSIFLSLPFFVLLLVKKTDFMIVQSLIILVVSGLYLIFAQFILARKWISLPLRLSFIDEWENKFKNYFSQITNL